MPKVIVYVPAEDARWLDAHHDGGHAKWVRSLIRRAIHAAKLSGDASGEHRPGRVRGEEESGPSPVTAAAGLGDSVPAASSSQPEPVVQTVPPPNDQHSVRHDLRTPVKAVDACRAFHSFDMTKRCVLHKDHLGAHQFN